MLEIEKYVRRSHFRDSDSFSHIPNLHNDMHSTTYPHFVIFSNPHLNLYLNSLSISSYFVSVTQSIQSIKSVSSPKNFLKFSIFFSLSSIYLASIYIYTERDWLQCCGLCSTATIKVKHLDTQNSTHIIICIYVVVVVVLNTAVQQLVLCK